MVRSWNSLLRAIGGSGFGRRFLFTVNRVCDLYFAADFLLMFSVAYFDNKHDVWILDRRRSAATWPE